MPRSEFPVVIMHDGFARLSTVRECEETHRSCAWCGQKRPSGRLFRYGTEYDDRPGRYSWHDKLFCSIDCMRSYEG